MAFRIRHEVPGVAKALLSTYGMQGVYNRETAFKQADLDAQLRRERGQAIGNAFDTINQALYQRRQQDFQANMEATRAKNEAERIKTQTDAQFEKAKALEDYKSTLGQEETYYSPLQQSTMETLNNDLFRIQQEVVEGRVLPEEAEGKIGEVQQRIDLIKNNPLKKPKQRPQFKPGQGVGETWKDEESGLVLTRDERGTPSVLHDPLKKQLEEAKAEMARQKEEMAKVREERKHAMQIQSEARKDRMEEAKAQREEQREDAKAAREARIAAEKDRRDELNEIKKRTSELMKPTGTGDDKTPGMSMEDAARKAADEHGKLSDMLSTETIARKKRHTEIPQRAKTEMDGIKAQYPDPKLAPDEVRERYKFLLEIVNRG